VWLVTNVATDRPDTCMRYLPCMYFLAAMAEKKRRRPWRSPCTGSQCWPRRFGMDCYSRLFVLHLPGLTATRIYCETKHTSRTTTVYGRTRLSLRGVDASVSSRESPCLGETRVPPGGSQTRRPDSVCRLRVHHRLLDFWRPNDEWALAALMSGRCRRGATEHVEPTSGSGKTLGRSAGL